MSALVYALALFGCSDDATVCERLSDNAQSFQSRLQCEMAMRDAFDSPLVRRADYPTVIGRCMNLGRWAKLGDEPVDLSQPAVRLAVRKANPEG